MRAIYTFLPLIIYLTKPSVAITGGRVCLPEGEKFGRGNEPLATPDLGIDFTSSTQLRKRHRIPLPVGVCVIETKAGVPIDQLGGSTAKREAMKKAPLTFTYSASLKKADNQLSDAAKSFKKENYGNLNELSNARMAASNLAGMKTVVRKEEIVYSGNGQTRKIVILQEGNGHPFEKSPGSEPAARPFFPKATESMTLSQNNPKPA